MECSTKAAKSGSNKNRLDGSVEEFKKNKAETTDMKGDIRNILRFTAGTDALFFFEGIVV